MYVVVVGVKIDPDRMAEVRQFLNDVIAPRAQEFAGFRAGYWLRFLGRSLLFFESEDAARARDGATGRRTWWSSTSWPRFPSLVDFVGHGTVRVANRSAAGFGAPIEIGSRRSG